jgi:hypothetical protein
MKQSDVHETYTRMRKLKSERRAGQGPPGKAAGRRQKAKRKKGKRARSLSKTGHSTKSSLKL